MLHQNTLKRYIDDFFSTSTTGAFAKMIRTLVFCVIWTTRIWGQFCVLQTYVKAQNHEHMIGE